MRPIKGPHGALIAAMQGQDPLAIMLAARPYETLDFHLSTGVSPLTAVAKNGYLDAARVLLDLGASIDFPDDVGKTPLMYVAQVGQYSSVRMLVEEGANVKALSNGRWTALHYAVGRSIPAGSRHQIVRHLLEHGANPNVCSKNQEWPLQLAIEAEDLAQIKVLLEYGADVNVKDVFEYTLLENAKEFHPSTLPAFEGYI